MNSMQEALDDALRHPREYHPARPPRLRKAVKDPIGRAPLLGLGIFAALMGVGLLMGRSRRFDSNSGDGLG